MQERDDGYAIRVGLLAVIAFMSWPVWLAIVSGQRSFTTGVALSALVPLALTIMLPLRRVPRGRAASPPPGLARAPAPHRQLHRPPPAPARVDPWRQGGGAGPAGRVASLRDATERWGRRRWAPQSGERAGWAYAVKPPRAVGAHLLAAAADRHAAPSGGVVLRPVVERPAAVAARARLEPRERPVGDRDEDDRRRSCPIGGGDRLLGLWLEGRGAVRRRTAPAGRRGRRG